MHRDHVATLAHVQSSTTAYLSGGSIVQRDEAVADAVAVAAVAADAVHEIVSRGDGGVALKEGGKEGGREEHGRLDWKNAISFLSYGKPFWRSAAFK